MVVSRLFQAENNMLCLLVSTLNFREYSTAHTQHNTGIILQKCQHNKQFAPTQRTHVSRVDTSLLKAYFTQILFNNAHLQPGPWFFPQW
jgi:hypothetical protein